LHLPFYRSDQHGHREQEQRAGGRPADREQLMHGLSRAVPGEEPAIFIALAAAHRKGAHHWARYGQTPVRHLAHLGVLTDRLIAAHCVWMDAEEIDLLVADRVGVVHCRRSNLKLASGIAPVPDMLRAGVLLGLGIDGAASNADVRAVLIYGQTMLEDGKLLMLDEAEVRRQVRALAVAIGSRTETAS
jgi:cytosine/adenosine deaminase-related metal-dependent hydrolase